jgi:hypothetical protein
MLTTVPQPIDVAGSDATFTHGAVLCCGAGEARLFKKAGYSCITAAQMRRALHAILTRGGTDAPRMAAEAAARCIAAVSDSVHPDKWKCFKRGFDAAQTAPALSVLSAAPTKATPMRDPQDAYRLDGHTVRACEGTTIIVAADTSELVRSGQTYVQFDCYRPHKRMDEPFFPQPGRVCLVTIDELRLVRLDGIADPEILLTFNPEGVSRAVVTRWPSPVRVLCGEFPGLRVGVATCLVAQRFGNPFFLGLTRGTAYASRRKTDKSSGGAVDYILDTDEDDKEDDAQEICWRGGSNVRQLIRYGGMRIYTGGGKRRKVQLRSLGLVKCGELAGAALYGLDANRAVLEAWLADRMMRKPPRDRRSVMIRKVRCKAFPQIPGGTINRNTIVPPENSGNATTERTNATKLRNMLILEKLEGGGVTAARVGNLREGGTYFLNGRAATDGERLVPSSKRCKIRCPVWEADDSAGLLAWLAASPHVVMAGMTPDGHVFGLVRVANGTEDQQTAAVRCWSENIGEMFMSSSATCSWQSKRITEMSSVRIGNIHHTNWRAKSLQTAQFERYQTQGDYSKPLKLKRRGTATPLERAAAYVEAVPLDVEGTRDTNATGVMLNVGTKFGYDALKAVMPRILEKSTLPAKQKNKKAIRILLQTERKLAQ